MTNIVQTALFEKSAEMLDAVSFLSLSHNEAMDLLNCYENTKTLFGKHAIAAVLCLTVKANIQAEEEIFHPAIKRAIADKGAVSAAIMSNSILKYLTAEIETLDPESAAYDIKIRVLGEHLKQSFAEKQTKLFSSAFASGKIDMWELGAKLQNKRKELLGFTFA